MTPKTQRILDKEATLFRDGDHPIYVLPDGRFAVKWGHKWVVKPSLKSIDKLLIKERPSLKLFNAFPKGYTSSRVVQEADVVEFLSSKIVDKEGKKQYSSYGTWYIFDQDKVRRLQDLSERWNKTEEEFIKEYEEILEGAIRVQDYNFKKLLKNKGEDVTGDEGEDE